MARAPNAAQGARLDQLPVTSVEGASTTLAGLLDETYTDGFIILKDEIVVYERYFNSMTPRTLQLLQSVAKSVTAAAAGVLVGRPSSGCCGPSNMI